METIAKSKVNWLAVALFFGVACLISWPFFWWRDHYPANWDAFAVLGYWKGLLPALGPMIGAVAAMVVFRKSHPRTVSLLGNSTPHSLIFLIAPVAAFAGVAAWAGENPGEVTLIAVAFVCYGFGEEAGWRGFLWDALRPLPQIPRVLLIALLWGAWHFTTFISGTPSQIATQLGLMSLVWIFGGWGLGMAVDRTKAVSVVAVLHLAFNVARHMPPKIAWPALGISAIVWVALFLTWPRPAADVATVAEK